jgi:alpha-amylase/alpha-mannosidase (GH57 family)
LTTSYPLHIAFIWHQHQPLYKSRVSGRYLLPWVRLHGCKDYLDLVALLARYPRLHQTVNLVPSLILQLDDFVAGQADDPYLSATLTPSQALTEQQRWFILEHGFDANHHTMIDVHPRYRQLYGQRQEQGMVWCWQNWQPQDYSDVMAWHNLAWIDPLFWDDPQIQQWFSQSQHFSDADRQQICEKQRQIVAQILPQHRQMQEQGQLEIITSPYTHPILPLLADTQAGRVAVPEMTLPQQRFTWAEDIPRHLRKAKQLYLDKFGCLPRGLWPSEQSVSPSILPDVAAQGFQWLCSDEAVLGWSVQHFFHRDHNGNLQEPELLYQPYRLETPEGDLSIVFRDHRLSDLIGFTYGAMSPQAAANDLISHLEAIRQQLIHRQGNGSSSLDRPWLVTIALDGENCWEFYQQDGKPFLENLYQQFSHRGDLQLVTVAEYLAQYPPQATLNAASLHSGSWVDGNFTTWIGDPVKNKAWDLLFAARQTLANHPEATEVANPEAWEALYAAEGSDWFWWFGEGHSSNQDAIFDQLFREHLMALYQSLGEPVPAGLEQPLEEHRPQEDHRPASFIHPLINGRGDEQDWNHAGRLFVGGSRGTMHRSSLVQRIWYGLDHLNFYLRFDFQAGQVPTATSDHCLHLLWYYPDRAMVNSPIPLQQLPEQAPLNYFYHHHLQLHLGNGYIHFQEATEHHQWQERRHHAQMGLEQCLEVAVPWQDLAVSPDWSLNLIAVVSEAGQFVDSYPEQQLIPLQVP